ncbi:MAG: DMT family transporter [Alphaproteobacteria bacterium]|nr:DMT family transporter [Alphaproteobacteria bacterium]
MLGVLYAALGAFTFALNNVAMRRGVVTGSVLQGMAMTVPIGGLSFLVMAVAFGELGQVIVFPAAALAWLAGQGVVHFVLGRYCNYKSNQLMGVNLAAPVVQLQVAVAMLLAVAMLHEKFTVLQVIGSVLMLGGSFVTQTRSSKRRKKALEPVAPAPAIVSPSSEQESAAPGPTPEPVFRPRILSGYLFALGAAMCYGASPLMARQAFLNAPGSGTAAAGCLAYAAATLFFSLVLLKPGSWSDIRRMNRENLPWFLSSAVLVAISQAFVYASLAVAPLMVVTPILQLSLVFRLFLSQLINRDYEVMNTAVVIGAFTAVLGSILVALDTDALTMLLGLPLSLANFLHYRLAGG